jgi:hypothetical protein
VLADERAMTAIAFLRRAVDFYRAHGVRVERLMTDGCCSYVKQGMTAGAVPGLVTVVVRFGPARVAPLVVVGASGLWSIFQTRRARWRLRQRSASLRDLPSACLRSR